MPKGRKATCLNIVASCHPQRAESEQARLTVGGDRINCKDRVSTPSAKLINSATFTKGAQLASRNLKDFHLETPHEPT